MEKLDLLQKRNKVVDPNRRTGTHQNCHPANTVRRCHWLNGTSVHDKEISLHLIRRCGVCNTRIIAITRNVNTIPVQTNQPPVDNQEQFRSDLGYTGQPRSHLLMAAADPTAATVKGSTTSRGNQ